MGICVKSRNKAARAIYVIEGKQESQAQISEREVFANGSAPLQFFGANYSRISI